jgi:hypothetical protein
MSSMFSDIAKGTLQLLHKEAKKGSNQRRIAYIMDVISNVFFERTKPFFLVIILLLVLFFLMNCFQFYYYMKIVSKLNIDNLMTY